MNKECLIVLKAGFKKIVKIEKTMWVSLSKKLKL